MTASAFAQRFASLVWCGKRNPSGAQRNHVAIVNPSAHNFVRKKASLGSLSSESTVGSDPTTRSAESSDSEKVSHEIQSRQHVFLEAPPGLEDLVAEQMCAGAGRTRAKLEPRRRSRKQVVFAFYAHEERKGGQKKMRDKKKKKKKKKKHRFQASLGNSTSPQSRSLHLQATTCLEVCEKLWRSAINGRSLQLEEVLKKLTTRDATIVKAALKQQEASRATNLPNAPGACGENNVKESTRSTFQILAGIEQNRIFMVRKICKLGCDSPEILKAYFSKFGSVEHVFASPKRFVDPAGAKGAPCVRPASVGFVVMEKADDVVNIFKQGLEHTVSPGSEISLTAYEHHDADHLKRNGIKSSNQHRFPTYTNLTEDNTLRINLQKLAEIDSKRIFMVKKIAKLGLGSAQILSCHFSQFGAVENVFITHSVVKRKVDGEHLKPTVRPAGFGFVVMESEEYVKAAFQRGLQQMIFGVSISLAAYKHHTPSDQLASAVSEELEASR